MNSDDFHHWYWLLNLLYNLQFETQVRVNIQVPSLMLKILRKVDNTNCLKINQN